MSAQKNLGTLEDFSCSKSFGHFGNFLMGPDNFGHLIRVEEIFHLCPNILGPLEKSFLGILGSFYYAALLFQANCNG